MTDRRHPPLRRPAWWPDNEPWPPKEFGSAPRELRGALVRHFVAQFAGLLLMLLLAVAGCLLVLGLAAFGLSGVQLPRGVAFVTWSAGLGLLAVGGIMLAVTGSRLRRTLARLGTLVEAIERISAGDYSVRVPEAGLGPVRRLARAVNRMVTRLQSSETQRRDLLADVTHELRTPLSVIQGNLEALVDGVYPADPEHLATLLDEAHVMSRLVEDLATLSHAESGTLALHREPVDLGVLAGEAVASFRAQAEAAGVRLEADAPPDLPLTDADPVRLREVLTNLIANGLRYTPRGGQVVCRVAIEGAPASSGPPVFVVTVSDTGRGIAPEDLPHIFNRFYKSPDSRGHGLGLAIAQSLVVAHGGTLAVTSAPGQGTVFTMRLGPPVD